MIWLNNKEVKFGSFPNGESYLQLNDLDIRKNNQVKFCYKEDSDIIKLCILKNAIDDFSDVESINSLYITYMPYGRMDRANGHYSVSLLAITKIINNLSFCSVEIREPHSIVTLENINNSFVDNWCYSMLERVYQEDNYTSIFFPDFGAKKRYNYKGNLPTAYGKKEREFLTGNIKGLKINGEVKENVLIIDDMCSRGGTFVEAAKILRENGAKRIGLLVSYCEENVFTGEIFNYIDHIYTSSESELTNHPRITKLN